MEFEFGVELELEISHYILRIEIKVEGKCITVKNQGKRRRKRKSVMEEVDRENSRSHDVSKCE